MEIIAVEHVKRVQRLQGITAAHKLRTGLMAAEQQLTADIGLEQALEPVRLWGMRSSLERVGERCSEMEGLPGLPMDTATELRRALEDAEAWLREQQRVRRPVAMPMRRQAIAVSAESRVAPEGLNAAARGSKQDDDEASALALVVQIAGQSVIAGFDTWAETSVVRRSLLTPDVEVTKVEAQVFAGVGGTKQLDELVRVPVQMRYGAEVVYVMASVMDDADMPEYVGLLFGTEAQDGMRAVYDCDDRRLAHRTLGIVIDLEEADVLVSWILFEPLRVLELCAGMSGSYGIMVDLGYRIEVWYAVKSDSAVAAVAMAA